MDCHPESTDKWKAKAEKALLKAAQRVWKTYKKQGAVFSPYCVMSMKDDLTIHKAIVDFCEDSWI